MFEAAELGRSVTKEEFEAQVGELRAALLKAQTDLRDSKAAVIVIISGADGAGKGDTVNRLHEWLDPRGIETQAFGPPSEEERDRPDYWRFWMALPPRGKLGIFFGSWYTDAIVERVYGESKPAALDQQLSRIVAFERMLVQDGAVILKFWFHLSKKAQKRRLERLEKNPKTRWRVTPTDWKHFKLYDRFVRASEQAIRSTDSGFAPWYLVEAENDHYRDLTVGRTILDQVRRRLDRPAAPAAEAPDGSPSTPETAEASITILDRVDTSASLEAAEYKKKLARAQARLAGLARKALDKRVSTVAMFEGWDAAGKGGAIRRMTAALDARLYRVISVAAPTDEERAHHYLWRFWRHIPRSGKVTIYDRSWYGRVLVERVEGFAREEEWRRAYLEINDFERQLTDRGIVLVKFWVHIDADEQLRRFKEREQIAYKQHKITDEDWRNREKWDAYESAVNEMVARTSTQNAPWTIVPGNDKKYARVMVLETVCRRLKQAL